MLDLDDISELRQLQESLMRERDAFRHKNQELQEELEQVQEKAHDLDRCVSTLKHENEELENEKFQLFERYNKLEDTLRDKNDKIEEYLTCIDNYKKELRKENDTIAEMKQCLKEMQKSRTTENGFKTKNLQRRLSDTQTEVNNMRSKNDIIPNKRRKNRPAYPKQICRGRPYSRSRSESRCRRTSEHRLPNRRKTVSLLPSKYKGYFRHRSCDDIRARNIFHQQNGSQLQDRYEDTYRQRKRVSKDKGTHCPNRQVSIENVNGKDYDGPTSSILIDKCKKEKRPCSRQVTFSPVTNRPVTFSKNSREPSKRLRQTCGQVSKGDEKLTQDRSTTIACDKQLRDRQVTLDNGTECHTNFMTSSCCFPRETGRASRKRLRRRRCVLM